MPLPPSFLEELRARLPVSHVVGRAVRLIRAGRGEFKGLCPFHKEKTPSFTVNDDKGFFHCFGCGAHGDAIGFLMQHDGLDFMTAVERLAGEAGLSVPRPDPADQERQRRQASLTEVLEAAAAAFEAALDGPEGRAARDYLDGRGVPAAARRRFRLGYAPPGGRAILDRLTADGADPAMLSEAGLLRAGQDGREPYPMFRDRLIFPVTDGRNRVVGFGGRLLAGDGPKYLNSADGPLFHKGRLLYNLAGARAAARAGRPVVLVEGYMDVIALADAGYEAAVAPLGTAVTEDQLELLWRLAPDPILCLDGDAAGRRAAWRAADRALARLKPDHTLRFAFLPAGDDPDSLVRRAGPAAFAPVLAAAQPLAEILWQREASTRRLDDPEARAGLQAALDRLAGTIADGAVQRFYRNAFRRRIGEAFFPRRGARGRPGAPTGPAAAPRPQAPRDAGGDRAQRISRLLVGLMIRQPALFDAHGEEFATLDLADPETDRLRGAVADLLDRQEGLDSAALGRHLDAMGWATARARLFAGDWAVEDALGVAADPVRSDMRWRELSRELLMVRIRADLEAARRALVEDPSEPNQARFLALQAQLAAAGEVAGSGD